MTDTQKSALDALFQTVSGMSPAQEIAHLSRPRRTGPKLPGTSNTGNLSARELQVLLHLSNGLPNKQIAREIDATVACVESVRLRLFVILKAKNAPHAVRIGFERGIL